LYRRADNIPCMSIEMFLKSVDRRWKEGRRGSYAC
jgi:hypothetical protein